MGMDTKHTRQEPRDKNRSKKTHTHTQLYKYTTCGIFFLSDTGDSSGRQANGVHGHLGPDILYSKSCKPKSFMRVRHVPEKRRRWGATLLLRYTCTQSAEV